MSDCGSVAVVLLSLRSDLPSDVEASFSDVRIHPLSSSEAHCQKIPNLALITLKTLHNPFDDVSQVYMIRAFSLGKNMPSVYPSYGESTFKNLPPF